MKIKIIPKGLIKREYFKDLKKDFIILYIENNITVKDLLSSLNIPIGFVSVIIINKKLASLETKINNNDVISLWPPVAGG